MPTDRVVVDLPIVDLTAATVMSSNVSPTIVGGGLIAPPSFG